jgi:hypothetical protein
LTAVFENSVKNDAGIKKVRNTFLQRVSDLSLFDGLCVIQKTINFLEQFFQRVLDYIILTYFAENHTHTTLGYVASSRRGPLRVAFSCLDQLLVYMGGKTKRAMLSERSEVGSRDVSVSYGAMS